MYACMSICMKTMWVCYENMRVAVVFYDGDQRYYFYWSSSIWYPYNYKIIDREGKNRRNK
jgi:hypothetical protein